MKTWFLKLIGRDPASVLRRSARRFNKTHTDTTMFAVKDGRWMCPDCGKIHAAVEWTIWTGAQYPHCCRYPYGHRVYHQSNA